MDPLPGDVLMFIVSTGYLGDVRTHIRICVWGWSMCVFVSQVIRVAQRRHS